jgi:hypothetical protein
MLSRRALFASPLVAVTLVASAGLAEAATSSTAKKKHKTATKASAHTTAKTTKKPSARS